MAAFRIQDSWGTAKVPRTIPSQKRSRAGDRFASGFSGVRLGSSQSIGPRGFSATNKGMKAEAPYPLPASIRRKLSELRGLIGRLIACHGLVLLGIWLLVAFWIFGLLDYLPARFGADESPRVVRVIMLAILAAGTLALAYHYFWNRWLVRWSDASLALAIEQQHPEFQSALITTVQAASPRAIRQTNKAHEAFEHPMRPGVLALTRSEAEKHIEGIEVRSLVRLRSLQWELAALAAVGAISGVIVLLAPSWTWHWGQRLLALSDAPWPRTSQLGLIGVELDVPPFSNQSVRERYVLPFRDAKIRVPKGASCQLKTWAERLPAPPYDGLTLYYRDTEGNRGRADMRRGSVVGERQSFDLVGPPLESLNDSLTLTLSGGDAKQSNIVLEVVDAPIVVSMGLEVDYPEYLPRSTKTVWGQERLDYRNGIRIPQGTLLSLAIAANKPIVRCEIMQIRSGATQGQLDEVVRIELEQPKSDFVIPIGRLDSNLFAEIRIWDTEGLCSTRVQQYVIAAIEDNPPQVDFVLEGIGTAITEQALLPIRSTIADDYDLNQAWIESIVDDQPNVRRPLTISNQGQANADIDLKALREAGENTPKVGSVLALMVSATDYLHSDEASHIGRSTPIQLSVVTPDQLLVILERRELAMRARLEQIIGELGQLRDLLLIMNRPPETNPEVADETDEDPEVRRNRLLLLRAQQADAQADKSGGELRGVSTEIAQIVAELINNRVDSKDRRDRLEQKIQKPMADLLTKKWEPFAKVIERLETEVIGPEPDQIKRRLEQTVEQNNAIIAELNAILSDMIDIQDFNEVIDMVRGMLEDQNQVLERTKEEQKKRLLELLK